MSISGLKTLEHQLGCGGMKLCLGMESRKPWCVAKASTGAVSFLCGGGSVPVVSS